MSSSKLSEIHCEIFSRFTGKSLVHRNESLQYYFFSEKLQKRHSTFARAQTKTAVPNLVSLTLYREIFVTVLFSPPFVLVVSGQSLRLDEFKYLKFNISFFTTVLLRIQDGARPFASVEG